jgi:hypothetical protein
LVLTGDVFNDQFSFFGQLPNEMGTNINVF